MRTLTAIGRTREVSAGTCLFEAGTRHASLFVVESGELELVRPSGETDTLLAVLGPGGFTGEANLLSGRPSLARAAVTRPGRVIEVDHERLLGLVRTDVDLGDVLMRAFILRRAELIAGGLGDVIVVGSVHASGTLGLREFLTRNGHPHTYLDLDRDPDIQQMLERFHVSTADLPVLICRGEVVLAFRTRIRSSTTLDFATRGA
jgi:thioredoxin reductase (NADPH)